MNRRGMAAIVLLLAAPFAATARAGEDSADARAPVHKMASGTAVRVSRDKLLAREDLKVGRFADAYHRLRPDVADARGDTEYLALLALAAMHLGRYGEAAVVYQRLAEVEPGSSRWRVGLGLAREGLGLEATSAYREALTLSGEAGDLRALLQAKLADLAAADLG